MGAAWTKVVPGWDPWTGLVSPCHPKKEPTHHPGWPAGTLSLTLVNDRLASGACSLDWGPQWI